MFYLKNCQSIARLLPGRKSSGSGLENLEYGYWDPLCWPRNTLYPQKLVLTSPTNRGRSVGYSLLSDWGHGICFSILLLFLRILTINGLGQELHHIRPSSCTYNTDESSTWIKRHFNSTQLFNWVLCNLRKTTYRLYKVLQEFESLEGTWVA
jgi:hypothetical protein